MAIVVEDEKEKMEMSSDLQDYETLGVDMVAQAEAEAETEKKVLVHTCQRSK